jgi:dephospho-CoA kinase
MHKLKSNNINLDEKSRLYRCPVPIVGLTGSIATGKSTVSGILRDLGLQIIDADSLVKEIYKDQATLNFIKALVPSVINNSQIDFKHLREAFFKDEQIKFQIEQYIYQELPEKFQKALDICNFDDWDFVIYDVPLLFEKNLIPLVDDFILVYTNEENQLKRLLNRDGINVSQANTIINSQISIEEKRTKSKNIIENNGDLIELNLNVRKLISEISF